MHVQFVGSGDAFGSGGRFNTCFHVVGSSANFLIDCGASSLIALKKFEIDRNAIDFILITHFHADHSGGLPFFMLDAQFFAKRGRPLTIIGPTGLKDWYGRAMDMAFPGSSQTQQKFELCLVEARPDVVLSFDDIDILPAVVRHGRPERSFYAYRITVENKVIAYTGDTEWTDSLIEIGREADLMIAEAYFFDKRVPLHLSYMQLLEKLPLMHPKRLILTHMNDDMLARTERIPHETASDGLKISL
jgi:ribonuclease BN (tRNA processing enzyme)